MLKAGPPSESPASCSPTVFSACMGRGVVSEVFAIDWGWAMYVAIPQVVVRFEVGYKGESRALCYLY